MKLYVFVLANMALGKGKQKCKFLPKYYILSFAYLGIKLKENV